MRHCDRIKKISGKLAASLVFIISGMLCAHADTVVNFDNTSALTDNNLSFVHRDYRWTPLQWSITGGALSLYLQFTSDALLTSSASALASISVHTDPAYSGTILSLNAYNPSLGYSQLGTLTLTGTTTTFNFSGSLPSYYTLVMTVNNSAQLYIDQLTLTTISAVPEPAIQIMLLLGLCMVGYGAYRRRASRSPMENYATGDAGPPA